MGALSSSLSVRLIIRSFDLSARSILQSGVIVLELLSDPFASSRDS